MKVSMLGLAVAAFLVLPAAGAAQQIQPGLWTGTVSPPDEEAREVSIDVVAAGDSVTAMLRVPSLPDFPPVRLVGLALDTEGRITFSFMAGHTITCLLSKQAEGYVGTCTADNSSTAAITMVPPKPKTPGGS